jgi:hypothetical protein
MSDIPRFLRHWISRTIWKAQAKQLWEYLQSNSNTVVVDDLEAAIRERRDWKETDDDA